VQSGRVNLLQWLAEHGINPSDPSDVELAASGGQQEVLEWMLEQGIKLTTNDWLCRKAAGGGDLAVLQWLRSLGCLMDVAECTAGVKVRMKYLQRCRYSEPSERHEEVLSWLRALGAGERSAA
jgi:hypothetical protein